MTPVLRMPRRRLFTPSQVGMGALITFVLVELVRTLVALGRL